MTRAEQLALVAHELRSPVAALEALAAGAAAARAAGTLDDVLALAVAAGRDVERLVADTEPLSVRVARVRVDELLRVAAARADLVRDDLPSETVVSGDPTRLRQLLGNLVANARRHGSVVAVEARRGPRGSIVVDVVDDGPGVEPALDPFGRGVSGAGSTGYGLWLARGIAEAHGGSLELVRGGPGTRFRLVLPPAADGR